jgi:hypothetical protein
MRRWIIYLLRRWDGRIYVLSLNVYKVVVVRIDETTHSPSSNAVLNNIYPTQTGQYSQNHVGINQSTTKESCGQQPHTRLSSAPRLDLDSHSPCLPTSKGHSARPTRYHDTSKLPFRASIPLLCQPTERPRKHQHQLRVLSRDLRSRSSRHARDMMQIQRESTGREASDSMCLMRTVR